MVRLNEKAMLYMNKLGFQDIILGIEEITS